MENIIFYTELDTIIGCTRDNAVKGDPFCDGCHKKYGLCQFKGQCTRDVQYTINNEQQLKATFIKLYLEKAIRLI